MFSYVCRGRERKGWSGGTRVYLCTCMVYMVHRLGRPFCLVLWQTAVGCCCSCWFPCKLMLQHSKQAIFQLHFINAPGEIPNRSHNPPTDGTPYPCSCLCPCSVCVFVLTPSSAGQSCIHLYPSISCQSLHIKQNARSIRIRLISITGDNKPLSLSLSLLTLLRFSIWVFNLCVIWFLPIL